MAEFIWKAKAPLRCRFFTWLAARDRCWTIDRLQRCLLPHPAVCPFCDQEPKNINHLTLGCVFARQIWAVIMNNWDKPDWIPISDAKLVDWWTKLNPSKQYRQEIWTVMILVTWTLWKHRNDIVFNGASPSRDYVLKQIDVNEQDWRAANLLQITRSLPSRVDTVGSSE